MKRDFFIIRHGETDKNVQGVWQGSGTEALLNNNGKKQASELAEKVKELDLSCIYCSPLLRAVQTANIIVQNRSSVLPVIILQDLRECHFGKSEGLTFDATKKEYGEDFIQKILFPNRKTWYLRFPEGECKCDVFERVFNALNKIAQNSNTKKDTSVGIICHAGVLNALQCGFGLRDVCYDNCSILHLCYDTATDSWSQVFDLNKTS